ncbi:copper chaperone PCu(A)C [Hansschlegelia beijingensis]|uniref:copper chaperone PCu(A)C n=1 Tax=Hansschlegelia beijingensis TaxID=1133344 RepID=UPI00387EF0B3
MFRSLLPALAALGLLWAGAASAEDYKAGDLLISNPWSRATATGAKVGAGYFTLTNQGSTPDRLVSVSSDFSEKAEMHETTTENGVSRMRPISGGLEIKPGETIRFEPGGKHLMFLGLRQPLKQGESVKGAVVFQKAGKVDLDFAVKAVGASPKAGDTGGVKRMDHAN